MFSMKNPSRTISSLAAVALAFLVAGPPRGAGAQATPESAGKVPVSSFNPATDKLDRTQGGPITRPMIIVIANNTYFINEFGMDAQYLLVGTKRALLIDTGAGFYDIKSTISKLTSLPYDVIITHGHPDHAGGMHEFPTVWIDPADGAMAESQNEHSAKMFGEMIWHMPFGYEHVWDYTPADAKWGDWDKNPLLKSLYDEQTLDLGGGRIVTVYHTPGHTPGSCVFLDHQTRILFTGDAANPNLLASLPIVTVLRGLLKIKSLQPQYDRIYNGHTAFGGTLDAYPQDPHVVDDLIANGRGLLSGELKGKIEPNPLFPTRTSTISVLGSAQIVYEPNNLWVPSQPQIIP